MGTVQNAFASVVEVPQQEHQARDEEADICRGHHDLGPLPHRRSAQLLHENLRIVQVLDDVEEEDLIELRDIHGELTGINVPLLELDLRIVDRRTY